MNKFATWTKVIITGCDGVVFQGYNKNVYEHKGANIYFRGSVIMRAHFKWMSLNLGL